MKRRFLSIVTLAFLAVGVLSCKDKKEEKAPTVVMETVKEEKDPLFVSMGKDNEGFEVFASDLDQKNAFIAEEEAYFDKDEEVFRFKEEMLTIGTFHGDEVSDEVINKQWLGLLKDGKKRVVAKATPLTKMVYDVVLDEEDGEYTGKEVFVENGKAYQYFFTKGTGVKVGTVDVKEELPAYVYPGDEVTFTFKGKEYTLFATGKKKKLDISSADLANTDGESLPMYVYEVKDYRLYILVNEGTSKSTTLLYSCPFTDDAMPGGILFAGDLNQDGKLDLILETSFHYNMTRPTLYLSQPCTGEECKELKAVAAIAAVGC
ncbi:MAG: hypothetical protein LBE34_09510 [Flavobacteriaceae bacterium]|jgi:hypothetical protein|nr:hypothetical protein [Flavobacteriaceae bacterium]